MSLTLDWQKRVEQWIDTMPRLFYQPLEDISLSAFYTHDQLTVEEAAKADFTPVLPGTKWGSKWQYAWFKTALKLPEKAKGKRIVFLPGVGSECAIYVNNIESGAWDLHHKEILLTRKGVPGEKYEIYVEAYAGHGPRVTQGGPVLFDETRVPEPPQTQVTITETSFGIWHEDIFQLYMDSMALFSLRKKMPKTSLRLQKIDRALCDMTLAVDLELPLCGVLESVKQGRKILKPLLECKNGSTSPLLYAFGHSHLDLAWLWPSRETESKCVRTLGNALALMEEYKEMKFMKSQPHLYQVLKNKYPNLYSRIKKAVKSGRWIPEGAMWVEPDTNITSGESLIRQFIHGKRFFHDEFGVDNKILWLPDVFGYSATLPQIMKKCGVKYFVTNKMYWAVGRSQPFPYQVFWWEGIDGTKVFAHINSDCNSNADPETLITYWNNRRQQDVVDTALLPFGHGDGGGGPTRIHLEYIRRQENLEGAPRIKHCHPIEYYENGEKNSEYLPTYVGELYLQNHRGTYTSQTGTKKGNRLSELALRESEMWSAVAQSIVDYKYPLSEFDSLWKKVLFNQFHDVLPGSSIARVHKEAENDYNHVIEQAKEITNEATAKLLKSNPDSFTLFNSLSWDRKALVTLPKGFKGVMTKENKSLPTQVIEGKTLARVSGIPSCGWLSLQKSKPERVENQLKVSVKGLENEYLKVTINKKGEITGIYDKEQGCELTDGVCNRFMMFKDVPFNWDAWNIDIPYRSCPVSLNEKAEITVKAEGPLIAVLQIRKKLNDSFMTQEIRLEADSRRIEFDTEIDWQERHKLLKVSFPVDIHSKEALHEIQFGHIARPTHESNDIDAAKFEVCQQKWSALYDNSHGIAILNDCKYGLDVTENSMNLTLLKSPLAPDMNADRGIQKFTYALYSWNGTFAESNLVREGYELNCKPLVIHDSIAESASLFSVDKTNIIIETVKAAEDGSGDIIVRLYESKRMKTKCQLTTSLNFNETESTDMLEKYGTKLKDSKGCIELNFTPFEIKTIRLLC